MWLRYRTLTLFAGLVFGQVLLLAYQIRRPDAGGVRLLRLWGVTAVVPLEDLSHSLVGGVRERWRDYFELRHVKEENRALEQQLLSLRLQNQALQEAANETARLRRLVDFRSSVGLKTEAAEVIGGGASADAQVVYINRGARQGLTRNMPVITPGGVVGKVSQVLSSTAQVLLITDPESGVGALLADSRIHGSLRGSGPGPLQLSFVLNDEPVKVGEQVETSGDDQIYPKGLPLGIVTSVHPGATFQQILVQPAAPLSRLESVLVVTQVVTAAPESAAEPPHLTAAEQRELALPRVPVINPSGVPLPAADFIAAQRRAAQAADASLHPGASLGASATSAAAASAAHEVRQPPTGVKSRKVTLPTAPAGSPTLAKAATSHKVARAAGQGTLPSAHDSIPTRHRNPLPLGPQPLPVPPPA